MTLHSTSHVRSANATSIIRLLRDEGAMTRADLVRASGLTRPTVGAIVKSLLQDGIAIESGTSPPSGDGRPEVGGRPGSLVWFNAEAVTAVAARVWHELELTHVTASGDVLDTRAAPLVRDPDRVLATLVGEIRRMTRVAGTLSAVSLAVPGFIDHGSGTVTYPALGWERVPVQSTLETELAVPVGLLSLPAAMLAGEIVSGAATGHDDAVLVLLEHGIGAGILSRGRLVVGSGGAVGELGHCPISSGLPCLCGRQGCLETVAAGWAIRAEAAALLGRPELAQAGLAELERLRDPRIDEVLGRAATELGAGAAWLVNLLDPSIVVLADTPFTHGADDFLRAFEESTRRQAIRPDVEIVSGSPDARLRGAVQAALELLPEQLRPRRVMCG